MQMQKMGSVDVDNGYGDITLDVEEDSVAVHTVKTTIGVNVEDPGLTMKGLEKRSSSGVRNASARIRQVTQELKRFALFSGRQPATRYYETKSDTTRALNGFNFINKTDGAAGWAALEKRFDDITQNVDHIGLLPRSHFGECLGMNEDSNEFAGELLDALMRRRHITNINLISKAQLKEFWEQIGDQSFDSRLQTFFDMVDKDENGRIGEDELREIIRSSASANRLWNIQEQAGEYATLIMEELDPHNHGYIMIESLKTLFLQPSTKSLRGESENLSVMLSQKFRSVSDTNIVQQKFYVLKYFLQDNWRRVWVIALWIAVMAILFTWKYVQYKNRAAFEVMGHCVSVAKGAAETLKLNMALILLPVCRNTITWLRNKTKLGVVVPFDDNLNFHKVISFGITIGVGLHAISHLACDFPRLLRATEEEYEPMQQYFGKQPDSYWWFVKGVEGWTGILMVVLMTTVFTLATSNFRRERIKLPKPLNKLTGFNAFWHSHHLFVIVYAMLIVHGIKLYLAKEWYQKTTWMYLAVPILLYAGERLTRALRSSDNPVKILKVAVYPGNVLALHMSKPEGFKYKSGQYMLVNCSTVSPFEWHPFSITFAPEDDYLGLHIQALGDWTTQLHTLFSQVCQPPANGKQGGNIILPKVLIDGPYSAPLQDYNKYDVVLLVGLGIRATPIFSVIKDILNNIKSKQEEDNSLETGGDSTMFPTSPLSKKNTSNNFKTTRAYCYWVTREQGTFNWFKGVMNEVAETDHDGVIEMHNYCTSVYEEDDARSAMIAILQLLNYAKNDVDLVSGTRVKSHFAKPDWRSVYRRIALLHPWKRIGVFYGGIPELVEELKELAFEFSHKTSTKFEFHKATF